MTTLITSISASQAQTNLPQILKEVTEHLKHIVISLKGNKQAVLMPSEAYQSWSETTNVLKDKQMMTDLKQAQHEITTGNLVSDTDATKYLGW